MDQKIKIGDLISMNCMRPGIIHIYEEEKITIGRDKENTNPIDDKRIADLHCSIFYQDGQVVLKNNCTIGTLLNKEKMGLNMEVNLKHGDHIHLLCKNGKKVGEKDVIAYLFYKYEEQKQSGRKSSKRGQPKLELLGDDLMCNICQDLYFEGVTVSPCGHVFCGYCLEGWKKNNNRCPICKKKIKDVTIAYQIKKVVDSYLEHNPQIQQKRKPNNKYYLKAAGNYQQNKSDSNIDRANDESDSEIENQFHRRIQEDQQLRRQQNNNINIGNILALGNQPIQPQIEQIQQQQNDQAQIIQPIAQNVQQQMNAQAFNRQAQNRHQNVLVQNAQAQMEQQQNGQQNLQAQYAQLQQAINIQPQNAQAFNVQVQNAPVNQQRLPIIIQGNQQRAQQHQQRYPNMQVQRQQPLYPQNQIPQLQPRYQYRGNQNQPMQAAINRSCRSCQFQYKGFRCQPFPYASHKLCSCNTKLPQRDLDTHQNADLKLFCQVCKMYFCKFYYGQQCDTQSAVKINQFISYRQGFNFNDNYFNGIEKDRLSRHLNGQDPTVIFDYIMQNQVSREQFYFQRNKAFFKFIQEDLNELLLPNTPICNMCIGDAKRQMVFKYVQAIKQNEVQFMRPDCEYGINCPVQRNDLHARAYNHICKQTKFA